MKKEFGKLSRAEQEKAELEYHGMSPGALDRVMRKAKAHTPDVIRLPLSLVKSLKTVAEIEGEPEYKTMVRKWVEERLQQETKRTRKSAKTAYPKKSDQRRRAIR